MKTKLSISLTRLKEIVTKLSEELRWYAQKADANPRFVEKQNALIQDLCAIHNDLDCLNNFDLWSDIEERMKSLEELDPQIDAHCILIHVKPGEARNQSFIEIKPTAI